MYSDERDVGDWTTAMGGHFEDTTPEWAWLRDESGASIEADLIEAGQRIWTRVLAYARRQQQDPARAADILEIVLFSLSKSRMTNGKLCRPIRQMDNYLYLAFVRKLNRELDKEPRIESVGSIHDLEARSEFQSLPELPLLDYDLLIEELMGHMDERTRRMFSLRHMGYSWNEIARIFTNTANNAQVLFNQGVKKVRRQIMKLKDKQNTSGEGGEADE
jgi:DNA-directed RNA polymerase specialized sigma24 family protein